ncbi:MAG: exodeoxyribonuclease VII large subunit [Phycisphaerales bacterium]|nr:MAG: exodeoxyribonuclease VII large subunit [Phycisphaerales bacterium]
MARKPFDPKRVAGGSDRPSRATEPTLFDPAPSDSSPSERGAAAPADKPIVPITVSQLVHRIRSALLDRLGHTILLIGEISDLSRPASGHVYMTLKDANCEVRAVMWRSSARSLKFDPKDGLEVLATGSVDVYEPRGQVQFYIRKLEPRGRGALELAFHQLYERLRAEGLFDTERKKPLPEYPERIGVVTSATGAAIHDIIQTLGRRYPPVELILSPVKVQGAGAAEEIAAAINRFNALDQRLGGLDLLIVGRGGGSLEDLWAFNEEIVARAIARSHLPVISAVGHEIDMTISDLVADVRAPTPTAAAELAVPDREEVLALLETLSVRLARVMRHALELSAAWLARLQQDETFRRPENLINRAHQRVDEVAGRVRWAPMELLDAYRRLLDGQERLMQRLRPARLLGHEQQRVDRLERRLAEAGVAALRRRERRLAALGEALERRGPARLAERGDEAVRQLGLRLAVGISRRDAELARALNALAARLEGCSHRSVLARGYSLTRDAESGRIIRRSSDVQTGRLITTQLRDGTVDSRVERISEDETE